MAETATALGRVPQAVIDYLEAKCPGVTNGFYSYTLTRGAMGDVRLHLQGSTAVGPAGRKTWRITSTNSEIPQAVLGYLRAQYGPMITNDAIGYEIERKPAGELLVHLHLVYNDSKLEGS